MSRTKFHFKLVCPYNIGFKQGASFNITIASTGRSFSAKAAYFYAVFIMNICLPLCVWIHTDLYFCHFHICTEQQTPQIVHALGYGIWSFILELNLSEEKHYNKYKPWQLQFDWKSAEVGGGPCPTLYLLQISGEGGDLRHHCPEPLGRGVCHK